MEASLLAAALLAGGCFSTSDPDGEADASPEAGSDASTYNPVMGNAFVGPIDFSDMRVQGFDSALLRAGRSQCMEPILVRVTEVIDGDTFEVSGISRPLNSPVRLIGIDTPEIGRGGENDQCFAEAAASFTRQLDGHVLWLTFDAECEDAFERLLAYVYIGGGLGDLWQRQLLRRGLARTLSIPPNTSLRSQFDEDERAAQQDDIGLWAVCR
ncbi:MAG: thermonuclease family protein [Myxococcota bacterium]